MKRSLPITVITGFLGAGKTSVLHHYLSEMAAGPIALIVEQTASIPLDVRQLRGLAGALSRPRDQILELPEEGQAAWLRGHLGALIHEQAVERVLMESSSLAPANELILLLKELIQEPELADGMTLSPIICVVDAFDFFHSMVLGKTSSLVSLLADLKTAQVESAGLIVLNKCDLISEKERDACVERLCCINPSARWLETVHGAVPIEGWKLPPVGNSVTADQRRMSTDAGEPSAIDQFVFSSPRPLHPERFWKWFQADHPGMLRAKGVFWLATRNLLVGGLSRTTLQNSCGPAGIWWAALPREEWSQDEASLRAMQETWSEPYGDRRQELILFGNPESLKSARQYLEDCLLNDEEFARSPVQWLKMSDPFPAWDLADGQG